MGNACRKKKQKSVEDVCEWMCACVCVRKESMSLAWQCNICHLHDNATSVACSCHHSCQQLPMPLSRPARVPMPLLLLPRPLPLPLPLARPAIPPTAIAASAVVVLRRPPPPRTHSWVSLLTAPCRLTPSSARRCSHLPLLLPQHRLQGVPSSAAEAAPRAATARVRGASAEEPRTRRMRGCRRRRPASQSTRMRRGP